jgi:hypothetical protein
MEVAIEARKSQNRIVLSWEQLTKFVDEPQLFSPKIGADKEHIFRLLYICL